MWYEKCREMQNEIIKMRRELHRIPEVGTDLPETRAYVAGKLEEYGIPYTFCEKDSGIVAEITGAQAGRRVALRADMDALPIQEENTDDYVSEHPGCMHACGHDAHMAMMLAAAKVLNANKDDLKGSVRLIFQTAEEQAKGAALMVDANVLDGVDAVFGQHIGTIMGKEIPAGKVIVPAGPLMASYDRFVITVKGKGSHGSTPENGIDPINIAAHIVLGLENINAREFNACIPVVVTVGKMSAGAQYNIIPETAVIEGTTRSFDETVRKQLAERIERVAVNTAAAFGGEAEVLMDWGGAPVVNDEEMAPFAAECLKEVIGEENVITSIPHPSMVGEDFSCYLGKCPGAFMLLSSSNPEKRSDTAHHNPLFRIDEDVLWMGAAGMVNIVEHFNNR